MITNHRNIRNGRWLRGQYESTTKPQGRILDVRTNPIAALKHLEEHPSRSRGSSGCSWGIPCLVSVRPSPHDWLTAVPVATAGALTPFLPLASCPVRHWRRSLEIPSPRPNRSLGFLVNWLPARRHSLGARAKTCSWKGSSSCL